MSSRRGASDLPPGCKPMTLDVPFLIPACGLRRMWRPEAGNIVDAEPDMLGADQFGDVVDVPDKRFRRVVIVTHVSAGSDYTDNAARLRTGMNLVVANVARMVPQRRSVRVREDDRVLRQPQRYPWSFGISNARRRRSCQDGSSPPPARCRNWLGRRRRARFGCGLLRPLDCDTRCGRTPSLQKSSNMAMSVPPG